MKPGMIITNDPTGERVQQPVDGCSYKIGALPIGTKICFVEKIPGQGAQLAMSSGRYGIVTGLVDRKSSGKANQKARPLVIVSFPYASMSGFKLKTPHGKFLNESISLQSIRQTIGQHQGHCE